MSVVLPIKSLAKLQEFKHYFRNRSARDELMFLIGICTGLRLGDILRLRVRDVQGTYIAIKQQKTGKRKYLYIRPELKRTLRDYCRGKDGQEFLIVSRRGNNKPIGRSMGYKILRQAGEQLGVEHVGSHSMRKTFGWHLYRQTKDVALLMEIFGHANQGITMRYLGILQDEIDKAIRSFKI